MTERVHHPYSPSTLQYREACPCYAPESGDSEASRAGTLQHDAFESGDLSQLTDEQAEAVEMCWSYRDRLLESCFSYKILTEEYLPIDDKDTTAGYLDYAIISADEKLAHIIDLKFGRWPVEPAENNLQGIAYLLGLRHRFPKLETVQVHFVMPYLNYVDVHRFHAPEFDDLYLRVATVVARAKDPNAKPTPTTGTCLFCAKKGTCPALHEKFLHVSKKFAPLELPDELNPALINDPAQAGVAMRAADLAKAWGEAVRRQVTLRVIEGAPEPEGYSLVESETTVIEDNTKIEDVAKQFLPETALTRCREYLLTKLDKEISATAVRNTKKKTVEKFRADLKACGALKEGAPKVYLRMDRPEPED